MDGEGDCPSYEETESFSKLFTGISPDAPAFGIRLCMYWRWEKPQDTEAKVAESKGIILKNAQHLLNTAAAYARSDAMAVAAGWFTRR